MGSKPWKAIKPMFHNRSSWKLRPGDLVQVITGKDKGKQGEVLTVIRDQRHPRVIVSGVNMATRRIQAQKTIEGTTVPGYSAKYEAPIHYSNVLLVDPETKQPVRVAFAYEDKPPHRKVRVGRGRLASGCIIPWPERQREEPNSQAAPRDTRPEDAEAITYNPEADFNLELPTAHIRLRELKEHREAAAAAAAAAAKQRRQSSKLFSSSSSSSRGYHTAAGSSGAVELQQLLSRCNLSLVSKSGMQQRLPLASNSSSIRRLLGCSTGSNRLTHSWCGLAAAPYLL